MSATLRQLIEKATPGPWNTEGESNDDTSIVNRAHMGDDWDIATVHGSAANAHLIARCSPATMLAVLEALEAHDCPLRHNTDMQKLLLVHRALRLLNAPALTP